MKESRESNERIKLLVVDDSPFSRRLITDLLDPYWFEVVGFADGFRSALEAYRTHMPDIVTLDVSGTEMDGLEVARRIAAQEPEAKMVIIAAATDEEFVAVAKNCGASAVIKKPFTAESLMDGLRAVWESEAVDDAFKNHYPDEFIASFIKLMGRFSNEVSVQSGIVSERFTSSGISVLAGITGGYSGRVILDLSAEAAAALAARLLKQAPQSREQINNVLAEFAAMVAKNASTRLNKEFRGLFLRVSPPAVFTGERFSIASPSLDIHVWIIYTQFGQIRFSVGFNKEVI